MATYQIYAGNRLVGGTDGCLDYIDGAGLNDKDSAIVVHAIDNNAYFYRLDSSSGATLLVDIVGTNITPQNYIKCEPNSPAATNTSINEFSTDGTMAGDSDDAAPTEKAVKTYYDTIFPAATALTHTLVPGYLVRPSFYAKQSALLTIQGGIYHINGAEEKLVYLDNITFTMGSGGSNASSHDLDDATDWHYIYIDDSEIGAGNYQIDNTMLINLQTEPAWSDANHGWYNGNDRCIFAVYDYDGAGATYTMRCHGDRFVQHNYTTLLSGADIDQAARTVQAVVPVFCKMGYFVERSNYVNNNSSIRVSPTGRTELVYEVRNPEATADRIGQHWIMTVDASGIFDIDSSADDNNTVHIFQNGFFLPAGL
jgi:hypothetical protein